MPTNNEVARIFLRIAEMMSYREESTFKVRAYYRAALTLSALATPLAEVQARGELEQLPGVGDAIMGKIQEILQTGTCNLYERLKGEVPEETRALLMTTGLTPRLVRLLETEYSVHNLPTFVALAQTGGLSDLEGTSVKVEDAGQLLRAAEHLGALSIPKETPS